MLSASQPVDYCLGLTLDTTYIASPTLTDGLHWHPAHQELIIDGRRSLLTVITRWRDGRWTGSGLRFRSVHPPIMTLGSLPTAWITYQLWITYLTWIITIPFLILHSFGA